VSNSSWMLLSRCPGSWTTPVPVAAVEIRSLLLKGQSALVPGLWAFEMANGLVTAERKRRLVHRMFRIVARNRDFAVRGSRIGRRESSHIVRILFASAHSHSLTAYDASYLELALRRRLPLATLDRLLQISARRPESRCCHNRQTRFREV